LNAAVGFCDSFLIRSVPRAVRRPASINGVAPSPSVIGSTPGGTGSSGR
jgi:hypothetical protein